jgi:hypothetical protein
MFQRLDKLMPQSVRRAGAEGRVRAAMVLDVVSAVLAERFGDDAALSMKPIKYRGGIVTVRCEESAMTEDIKMHESDIVREANRKLGEDPVSGIRAIG